MCEFAGDYEFRSKWVSNECFRWQRDPDFYTKEGVLALIEILFVIWLSIISYRRTYSETTEYDTYPVYEFFLKK